MTDYTKITDFAAKDTLPTGSAGKIIRGSEFETEFDNISTAIATKADANGGTLTSVDINSGTIDGTNIGANVAGTGNFSTLSIAGTAVTATATELNTLDGITSSTAELNILDGVTSTAAELNIVDGDTTATATTLANADRVVVNDAGTMVQVALTDFETYFESALDTLSNVTTVGALNAGSITSGFGAINNGSSAITTTGTVTYGSLSDGSITITAFVDEDTMSSNSATLVPTQQSVKAYVDTQVSGAGVSGITSTANSTAITIDSNETVKINGVTVGASSSSADASNSVLGENALASLTTGSKNVAIGERALYNITSNIDNVAIGWYALNSANNTSASRNVAIGNSALQAHTDPRWSVAVGYSALRNATFPAWANTALGNDALENLTTGSNNTGCGAYAGDLTTTGSNNTTIGYNSDPSSASASNQVTLGNTSVTSLRCNVTSITSLSDIRDKTNIADLSDCASFIKEIEPVSFDWNRRDESLQGVHAHGFIAQQLKSAQESTGHHVPGLVFEDNPDKLEAAYGNLLPTVVAALKEALVEIDELKEKVAALENA
jgi:hypothetical protein